MAYQVGSKDGPGYGVWERCIAWFGHPSCRVLVMAMATKQGEARGTARRNSRPQRRHVCLGMTIMMNDDLRR